ncbi:hypothetical protein [Thermococcus sp. ES12]|uniref:hypothetical protein n=1 Tax=Thermococcus sp. ES12 TaxID=1638246 RepID=UPI00142F96C2|nr:hypothetical protein [Thermococcus sp. ES12]NJE76632.1 hypothetical protein [Thermococcus sp. ES12]
MKKYSVILILILVTGLTAGCIGSNDSTTSSQTTSQQTEHTPSTTTTESISSTTTEQSPTETPTKITTDELLAGVSGIEQFTYTANAEISMLVVVKQANLTQRDNVTLAIRETGYMDFESWSAWINTTTISVPDNASTNTSRIVVGNVTYIQTPMGWIKTSDPATADFMWRYNLVSLAKKYLRRTPDEREEGKTLVLRYYLSDQEVVPLAMMYFAATQDTQVSVENGLLELYFDGGNLIGGRISFSVSTVTSIDDPTIGKMTITQDGSWSETIAITSVNEKRKVTEPST